MTPTDDLGESPPTIDEPRLLDRLHELAQIGAEPSGGVTRLAYTEADVRGRDLVARWMTEAGLEVRVDPACNLIGSTSGTEAEAAPLVVGSHLDTVANGGRLDGAYGVLAGVEVAAALLKDGPTRHPLSVVAFANEEGAGGADSFDGSRAIVGRPNSLTAVDRAGHTLSQRLDRAGGASSDLPSAAWTNGLAAFVELHIEQGPVLDETGISLGAVTGITGRRNIDVTIEGKANHAGTTPMGMRTDALTAAARAILLVEQLPEATGVRVATTGIVDAYPNVRNVVPGTVTLGVEMRDLHLDPLDAATTELRRRMAELATETDTTITLDEVGAEEPVLTDPVLTDIVTKAAALQGIPCTPLASGAGHDAQVMADLGPIAMIFVPSRDGASHSPREHTDPDDLVAGAKVLLTSISLLDEHLHHTGRQQ